MGVGRVGPHVSIALGGQVLVLSVHVAGATVGGVAQPDVKVLQPKGTLLQHLATVDDFP